MTNSSEQRSARIYQFPTKPRATASGLRQEDEPGTHAVSSEFQAVACGGAWYHDEAIQEAKRARRSVHRSPTQ